MSRPFKLGLLGWIAIAIAAGIVCGLFFPSWAVQLFATFNALFFQFLGFMIPLIILCLITPAIAELGQGAGKWLGVTAGIAYGSTLFAGFMSLGASLLFLPMFVHEDTSLTSLDNPETALLAPFFTLEINPAIGVMTALVLAFVLGVGITATKSTTLLRGFTEARDIINLVIAKVIIPGLPIYIFGTFLNMTYAGQVWKVITTFLGVILMVLALTVVLLIIQYVVAGLISGRNPFRSLRVMLPAYATALGTSSSAATIPVTLRCAISMGISKPVASFVIPLCATIHLAGSMTKITGFSIAVMMISGWSLNIPAIIGFILMLGVMMVAAPGVPGGAIMTAAGILTTMLGFTEPMVSLMIATYVAIDSVGTATNVTGDGAIAMVIDKFAGEHAHDVEAADAAPAVESAGE